LVGRNFNGHNLHTYLRECNIDSKHLVWNKRSKDEHTYVISSNKPNREKFRKTIEKIQKEYCLNNILGPFAYDILYSKCFLETDIVHYHLIHNLKFDIQLLPILTRLKPTVWTLHDPWGLSGHCIHHFNCMRWKTGCGDCPLLEVQFKMEKDNTALNFEIKKNAIQNSKLDIIVSSKWMKNKVEASPIYKKFPIHHIPFGINQEIFKQKNRNLIREKLKIPRKAIVIAARCNYSEFKGFDYIEYALDNIKTSKEIYFLVLGDELKNRKKHYKYIEYGWVVDEDLLADIYNASDLWLMPSIMEAFGMMAIEAMSCGVIPLVLKGTALPEIVNAPDCGIAIKKDKNEFTKVIQNLIENETERKERAIKCLRFAQINYNKDTYVSQVIEIYNSAMKNHSLNTSSKTILHQLKTYMQKDPLSNSVMASKKKDEGFKKQVKDVIKKTGRTMLKILPDYRKLLQIEKEIKTNVIIVDSISDRVNKLVLKNDMNRIDIIEKFNKLTTTIEKENERSIQ